MTDSPTFVIDTNVVLSAFVFSGSFPRQALDLALRLGKVLASVSTLEELEEVLFRPRFDRYLSVETRSDLLAQYFEVAL